MLGPRLKGERGLSSTAKRGSRFHHPIAENANAADAPLAKPFPMGEHL